MTNLHGIQKGLMLAGMVTALVGATQTNADVEQIELIGEVEQQSVWQVDYKGKPPYKRKRVLVDVVDVAAIEPTETQVVWKRSAGKPPYRRQWVEVPVIDAASLEVLPSEGRKVEFRGSPPFRRY